MATVKRPATIDDLYAVANDNGGTYELVNGELVYMSPTGFAPTYIAGNIYSALREHQRRVGVGRALGDGIAYVVNLPKRRSFNPDASYTLIIPPPERKMKFIDGAPVFAAEVRSEHDYGAAANRAYAAKRADYFAAGTRVVWDVDPVAETVHSYRYDRPDAPTRFGIHDQADAEPALPGWSVPVATLFA